MTNYITKHKWGVAASMAVSIAMLASATVAYANPSFFAPQAMTATATSSPAFLTAGVATSTVVYDSFNLNGTNQPVASDPTAADEATLLLQFTGSSTSAVLNVNIEYSNDNVDWYQDNLEATTSGPFSITQPDTYTWTYAASQIGGVTVARVGKAISLVTPTRYTRAVISTTGANGSVWVQFVPKKQNH